MKKNFALLTCLLISDLISAQTNPNEVFLHSKDQNYAILKGDTAFVYSLGIFYHKLGDYKCLRGIDTLLKNTNNSFMGKKHSVSLEHKGWVLTQKFEKKIYKTSLDTAKNITNTYYTLNLGYYLTQYSDMSREINKLYPLTQLHDTGAYQAWIVLPSKDIHYLDFRKLADKHISTIKQVAIQKLEKHESIKGFIAQNAKTAPYEVLRDSLSKLSTGKERQQDTEKWRYYLKAVHEIAEQKPEFFFKLAEDLPDNQHDIFFSINFNEKELLAKLKLAEGNKAVKKRFFKAKRSDKRFAIVAVTAYVASLVLFYGALIVWIF